ncbi:hypothetical protein [Mesorhizobium sp. ANAO-SY3R2]|uniref:thiolase C-terminal domain-containing protein n=1 Tax=Mesorhizobium sp. ANAO-SY3R2 TaxID=3166644 RepID=UPI00366F421D
MALNNKVAVLGSAIHRSAENLGQSLEELLYAVVQEALLSAGLTIEDIDGIVVASNDQYDGRAISVMAASGSVGGVDRDILSTPSAGEHAFVLGVLRVASGQYRTQLLVSWSTTEADSLSNVQRLAADPYFHRRLPLDEASAFALQASVMEARIPSAAAAAVSLAERWPASRPAELARYPLTPSMLSKPITGVVAMVLAIEDFVEERGVSKAAWVRGMGWATETGFLGDRDLATAPALEKAAESAFVEAGLSRGPDGIDLAEVADPTPYQQLLALECLGLSGRDRWQADIASGRFERSGALPVNLSGGARSANASFCNGLISIAETANQVLGRSQIHQIAGARTALAHAASGFAMQYQTVAILSQDR